MSAEDDLIARYFKPLASHPGALGLADDCAAIAPPAGHDLVLKTDGLIEGVHFFPDDPSDGVARKALRVNLSDLAAKGAQPLGFLLAIALRKGFSESWLAVFTRALGEDAAAYACPLLGGDTDSTPGPISISVMAFGSLPQGTMVRRNGARAGDLLFVSGALGEAALGLAALRGKLPALAADTRERLVGRYRVPQPRTALAEAVRTHASAAIDISDGFAGDLAKLCGASGVTVAIDCERLPLAGDVRALVAAEPGTIETIVTGGEDYEILCTVPPAKADSFRSAASRADVPVTEIGTVEPGDAAPRLAFRGRPLTLVRPSWSHF
jgi:thiamine-monophosphate kinase